MNVVSHKLCFVNLLLLCTWGRCGGQKGMCKHMCGGQNQLFCPLSFPWTLRVKVMSLGFTEPSHLLSETHSLYYRQPSVNRWSSACVLKRVKWTMRSKHWYWHKGTQIGRWNRPHSPERFAQWGKKQSFQHTIQEQLNTLMGKMNFDP